MVASGSSAGKAGEIYRVAGPVVTATGLNPRMYDVMLTGKEELMGEVIRIVGDRTTIQVYEDTSGIRPGEPVVNTGQPLNLELGPGLLGSIYDGIQRPLPVLKDRMGDFILRGVRAPGLDRQKTWPFKPLVKAGDTVQPGQVLGLVQEAKFVEHRVMVPPKVHGTVKDARTGTFRVDETVVELDTAKLALMQTWPVRTPRPVQEKLMPAIPLITGQRVFDFLFPIAKGGTAAIPGGFGCARGAGGPAGWAEGRREISSRLEGTPGGGGSPAYLSARLSEFYERAGRVKTLQGPEGSVSVVGAVSPSGGDFSEPVTQGTLRITKVFWALDTKLRERRHFPAVNWLTSYTLYTGILDPWYRKNIGEEWPELREWASKVLQEEAELEEILRLVGADALPEDQQVTLEV